MPTRAWDEASPAGADTAAATQITNFKIDVRERMDSEHYAYAVETGYTDYVWRHDKSAARVMYGTAANKPTAITGGRLDGAFYWETDNGRFVYWNVTTSAWDVCSITVTGSAVDHGTLAGLADDDHTGYLLVAATRGLSADWDVGSYKITAQQLAADVAIGTTPLIITSTTLVSNLNADLLDGNQATAFVRVDGTVALTANWDAGAFEIRALTFESDVVTGTAPFTIASTTVSTNLNADLLDAKHSTAFALLDGTQPLTAGWDVGAFEIRALTFQSDVVTGTAPFTVASTTVVTNLNADTIDGREAANLAVGVYRTRCIDAAAMVPRTTNGATAATSEYATNDIMVDHYLFDGATEEAVQFKLMMPDEWDLGTVKVKVFWDAATGATAADGVVWGLRAGAISNNDAIDAALGTEVLVTDAVLTVGKLHTSAATGAVTVGGTPALGDMIWFQVSRKPAEVADDMTEDAKLLGVAIQYKELTTAPSIW